MGLVRTPMVCVIIILNGWYIFLSLIDKKRVRLCCLSRVESRVFSLPFSSQIVIHRYRNCYSSPPHSCSTREQLSIKIAEGKSIVLKPFFHLC